MDRRNPTLAHLAPLVVFLSIGLLGDAIPGGAAPARLWVYPVQAIVGLALVAFFRPAYQFGPMRWSGLGWVLTVAPLALILWIAPSWVYVRFGVPAWMEQPLGPLQLPIRVPLGLAERTQGFDPAGYEGTFLSREAGIGLRFLRSVITVPLVEEICWRGFVMRQVDDPDRPFFENPFGRHQWRTCAIVTGLVVLVHQPVDWPGAFCFGLMAYLVAVRTKSLGMCVVFHALVNLLLGIHVLTTRQWGYW